MVKWGPHTKINAQDAMPRFVGIMRAFMAIPTLKAMPKHQPRMRQAAVARALAVAKRIK